MRSDVSSSSTSSSSAVSMMECSSSADRSPPLSSSPFSGFVMRRTKPTDAAVRGLKTSIRARTGPDRRSAKRVAFRSARIFGTVSPTMMTTTVRISVDTQVYPAPMRRIAMIAPRDEAAILTRLLPMRIAESALSNRSSTLRATCAFRFPFSARCSSLTRLAADSDISEAEKKADSSTQSVRSSKTSPVLTRAHPLPGRPAAPVF